MSSDYDLPVYNLWKLNHNPDTVMNIFCIYFIYCIYKSLKKSHISYLVIVKSSRRLYHILPRDHKHSVRFKWISYIAFSEVSLHQQLDLSHN